MCATTRRTLQFGHGGEPWRTFAWVRSDNTASLLQFGHGGEPWRTAYKFSSKSILVPLQFGHGGEPWRTDAVSVGDEEIEVASIRPRR